MGDTMQRPRKRRWGNELARQRRARLADFAQRGAFEPGDLLRHARRGWVYVPVHAMADEHDALAALGLEGRVDPLRAQRVLRTLPRDDGDGCLLDEPLQNCIQHNRNLPVEIASMHQAPTQST